MIDPALSHGRHVKKIIGSVRFLVAFVIILVSTQVSAKEKMLFVYFNDYPPFGWEENQKMRGIYIDIVNEVFENRLGISVQHKGYPWKRAQLMVKLGSADGFCTVVTPERLTFSKPTQESIIDVNFKIFAYINSPKREQLETIDSIAGLKGFKLVDYMGSGWAEENLVKAGLDIYWLAQNEQIWKLLINGRADATVKNEWTTRYALKKAGYHDQILEFSHPMNAEPTSFHIFIGNNSLFLSYRKQVDEELADMKKHGVLQRIYDQYK